MLNTQRPYYPFCRNLCKKSVSVAERRRGHLLFGLTDSPATASTEWSRICASAQQCQGTPPPREPFRHEVARTGCHGPSRGPARLAAHCTHEGSAARDGARGSTGKHGGRADGAPRNDDPGDAGHEAGRRTAPITNHARHKLSEKLGWGWGGVGWGWHISQAPSG